MIVGYPSPINKLEIASKTIQSQQNLKIIEVENLMLFWLKKNVSKNRDTIQIDLISNYY